MNSIDKEKKKAELAIVDLFKETRSHLGLSQVKMARILNISQCHLANIEAGRKSTSGIMVMRVQELNKRFWNEGKAFLLEM